MGSLLGLEGTVRLCQQQGKQVAGGGVRRWLDMLRMVGNRGQAVIRTAGSLASAGQSVVAAVLHRATCRVICHGDRADTVGLLLSVVVAGLIRLAALAQAAAADLLARVTLTEAAHRAVAAWPSLNSTTPMRS